MRIHLHHYLLTVNLFSHYVRSAASVAAILPSSSSSTTLVSTTKRTRDVSSSPPLISELEEYETYDDEDDYRKNEEWWKDPFAQFESEEAEEIPADDDDLKQSNEITDEADDMVVVDDDDDDQFDEIKDETMDSKPLLPNLESERLLPDEEEEEEKEGSSKTNLDKEGEDDQLQEKKQKKSNNNNNNNNNILSTGVSQSRTEQQRQQLPVSKLQQQPLRRKRSATSILSATPTVPALLLQNIVRKFSPHVTAVQLFLSLAIGNLAIHYFQKINSSNNKRNEERTMEDEGEIDMEDNIKEEEDEEYLDEEELRRLEQLGFARPSTYFQKPPHGTSTVEEVQTGTISEDEEEYVGVHFNSEDDDCADLDVNKSNKSKSQFNWGINSILNVGRALKGKKDTNEDMFESTNYDKETNDRQNNKRKQKKLSNAELQQELEAMRERVDRVEHERDLLEREYDSSSRKVRVIM